MLKKPLKEQIAFQKFCELKADRKGILISVLDKEKIPYTVLKLGSASHLILYPKNLVSGKNATVLLAHYDRVNGTPGANDNSASVFYLLYHGKKLKNLKHNTIIIFTDKEEVQNGDSITSQGSYELGKYLRSKNIENLRFFVFDMCGIGTTLLLGTGGEDLLKKHYGEKFDSSGIKKKIDIVKHDAEDTLLTVNCGEFFYLNPLFSDDLGLILNQYPAVLISLLPYREAVEYKNDTTKLPKSWLCNHTIEDSIQTLDNRSWSILSQLFSRLSNLKEIPEIINSEKYSFMCYQQRIDSLELSRGGIKKPLDYIIKEGFSISNIQSDYRDILERFLFFSSKIEPKSVAFINSLILERTEDLSYDLYNYLTKTITDDYKKLPKSAKERIEKLANIKNYSINNFLYNNIMKNIQDGYYINSTPINKKTLVLLEFNESKNGEYCIHIHSNNNKIGSLKLLNTLNGYLLERGDFIPYDFLRLDPLNLLKGIRLLLIKWVKLNNNNSLRINLIRSNWIGCDQFYRLLEMELEGKTTTINSPELIYIWKRYNG